MISLICMRLTDANDTANTTTFYALENENFRSRWFSYKPWQPDFLEDLYASLQRKHTTVNLDLADEVLVTAESFEELRYSMPWLYI